MKVTNLLVLKKVFKIILNKSAKNRLLVNRLNQKKQKK